MSANDNQCNPTCINEADQFIALIAAISGIINNEIEDDNTLNIVGNFLQALGTNLSTAAAAREKCRKGLE